MNSGEGVPSYNYQSAVIVGLCEGPIESVLSVWSNKTRYFAVPTHHETITETFTVPDGLIITVNRSAGFYANIGIIANDPLSEDPNATIGLGAGVDYTVTSGVYTFRSGLSGRIVYINYEYVVPDTDSLGNLNLSAATGEQGQAVWGHLTTNHPTEAIGYSGLCYVKSPSFALGANGELPNLTFEVQGAGRLSGHPDAQPDYIITDFLTNPLYGAGWPTSKLADLTDYATYCRAAGLFISPAFTEQKPASDHIKGVLKCTNSEPVWSQGKLKIIPYADATITGNGVTYTPNNTPTYDLTDDDFLVSPGDDPISCSRITTADAYNHVQVEFVNRDQDYNIEIAEAKDQADIEAKGLRTQDPLTMHMICDPIVARVVAQLNLQRTLYIRNTYKFKLGWKFCRLEPMDLITLTDTAMGLNQTPAIITEIEEDADGGLAVTAEEYPFGVSSHALYPHQSGSGYVPDYQVSPGNSNNPAIFEGPAALTVTGLEVWLATSGGADWGGCEVWISEDNVSYTKAGVINGGSRHGVLSASLATNSGTVDNTHTLSVDLTVSKGQLLSGSDQDLTSLNTLCYADGELLAYKTATLTSAYHYNLTHLSRGAYDTTISAHSSGTNFARLDQSIFKYPFRLDQIGKTIFIKLASFNIYGGATQSLANVTAHGYTITGSAVANIKPANLSLDTPVYDYNSGTSTRRDITASWTAGKPSTGLQYEVQYQVAGGSWVAMPSTTELTYLIPTLASGSYTVRVRSLHFSGAASGWLTGGTYVPLPDTNVPTPTGLEIFGQGNNTVFLGDTAKFRWNYVSPRSDTELSGPGRGSSWFKYYIVSVYDTSGNLRRIDYRTVEWYEYTVAMNHADATKLSLPIIADIRVDVSIMASWNEEGLPASITVSNPTPDAPVIGVDSFYNGYAVGITPVPDNDGPIIYEIYEGTTSGFTPSSGNLVNRGPETLFVKRGAAASTVYIKALALDVFGNRDPHYCSAVSVTPAAVVTEDIADNATTDIVSVYSGSPLQFQIDLTATSISPDEILTVTIVADGVTPITIMANMQYDSTVDSWVQIRRGSTEIAGEDPIQGLGMYSKTYKDTPTAGTHTYSVVGYYKTSPGSVHAGLANRFLMAVRNKK